VFGVPPSGGKVFKYPDHPSSYHNPVKDMPSIAALPTVSDEMPSGYSFALEKGQSCHVVTYLMMNRVVMNIT